MDRIHESREDEDGADLERAQQHRRHYAQSAVHGKVSTLGAQIGNSLRELQTVPEGGLRQAKLNALGEGLCHMGRMHGVSQGDALAFSVFALRLLRPSIDTLPGADLGVDDPFAELRLGRDLLARAVQTLEDSTGIPRAVFIGDNFPSH